MELSVLESSGCDPLAARSDGGAFVESQGGVFPHVARLASEAARREKGV